MYGKPPVIKSRTAKAAAVLAALALFYAVWYCRIPLSLAGLSGAFGSQAAGYALNYILSGLIPLCALYLMHRPGGVAESMGLKGGFAAGIGFAAVCVLPLLAGYALIGRPALGEWTAPSVIRAVAAAAFSELIYSGFAFGQLFRYAGWGFVPAVAASALPAGAAALCAGNGAAFALSAFMNSAAAGAFYSWIYAERQWNLWSAAGLHVLAAAVWTIFPVNAGPAAGIAALLLRPAAAALAVALTVRRRRRLGIPPRIRRGTLWVNRAGGQAEQSGGKGEPAVG